MANPKATHRLQLVRHPMPKIKRPGRGRFKGIAAFDDMFDMLAGGCLDQPGTRRYIALLQ